MTNKKDRIIVVDAPPGDGKTSWAISNMNKNPNTRYMYVTPFLKENDRILEACPDLKFVKPDVKGGRGRKSDHLLKLIRNGDNISTTHALFRALSDDAILELKNSNYTLILDETFEVLDMFDLWGKDFGNAGDDFKRKITLEEIESLRQSKYIDIVDGKVLWVGGNLHKHWLLKSMCERGLIYFVHGTVVWAFPPDAFHESVFDKIYVLTHLFDYQMQSSYYKYFDIPYKKVSVSIDENNEYVLSEYSGDKSKEWKRQVLENIEIISSDKINDIGNPYMSPDGRLSFSTMSKTWYERYAENRYDELRNNLNNFYKNKVSSKSSDRMWTIFDEMKPNAKTQMVHPKNWIPLNSRATNEHREKRHLAYLVNRYPHPYHMAFFSKEGSELNKDEFAISELTQWIWRSAIRENKKIILYIPSYRMRNMLISFLNDAPLDEYKTNKKWRKQ